MHIISHPLHLSYIFFPPLFILSFFFFCSIYFWRFTSFSLFMSLNFWLLLCLPISPSLSLFFFSSFFNITYLLFLLFTSKWFFLLFFLFSPFFLLSLNRLSVCFSLFTFSPVLSFKHKIYLMELIFVINFQSKWYALMWQMV